MKPSYKLSVIAVIVAVLIVGAADLLIVTFISKPSANKPASQASMAAAASLALTSVPTGSVNVGELQHIHWTSSDYASPIISLSIIRKVSEDPDTYVLVRQVAKATANDGDAVWVPAPGDTGPDIYIQVGCTDSAQACTATPLPPQPLAVKNDGRYANTAAVFQAVESEYNN